MIKHIMIAVAATLALAAGVYSYQNAQFDFQTIQGDKVRWQELEGQWVVVNYFAEWCAPCLKEIPELNNFAEFAGKQNDLSFFAASYDLLSEADLVSLQQKYAMTFPLIKTQYPVMPNERPKQLPATFIISPEGKVVKQLLGEQTDEKLQAIYQSLQNI